jgi:CRP-like cAMP-binding protein
VTDLGREALGQTILLGGLDDAVLDELAAKSSLRRYERGQVVVAAGEDGGQLLVVAAGRLRVVARSADGSDLLLGFAHIGDTLGELSVLDRTPRSATIEAAEPAAVLWVPGDAVVELLRREPMLAEELLRQQADTIRRVSGLVADLVFLDLPRRVAKYVAERADGSGRADLAMSQTELAAAVGGVRQSVNGALRALERRGWIAVDGRVVTVHDRAALENYAEVSRS